ncbi:MAG: hypothetical protein ACRD27_10240 [Terracidiphilus sp.]
MTRRKSKSPPRGSGWLLAAFVAIALLLLLLRLFVFVHGHGRHRLR